MDEKRLQELTAAVARRPGSSRSASNARIGRLATDTTRQLASRRGSSGAAGADRLAALVAGELRTRRHRGSAQ
jgi:hypothetical protein